MKNHNRGVITKVVVNVVFPDGQEKSFEHDIGDNFGGILFDDGLINELLKKSNTKVKELKDGIKVWGGTETTKPSYLLIPRIVEKNRCACAKTGTCINGGDCDTCPSE